MRRLAAAAAERGGAALKVVVTGGDCESDGGAEAANGCAPRPNRDRNNFAVDSQTNLVGCMLHEI